MTDITIFTASGEAIVSVPITADAKHVQELMKKDQIELKWNDSEAYKIPIGAFVEWQHIRYYLAEPVYPDSKGMGVYTYTPIFVHEIYLLSKMPFLLIGGDTDSNSVESDWNYTGSLADLVSVLKQSIKACLGVDYSVTYDESIAKALTLSFSDVSMLGALAAVAEALGGEWYADEWINGYTGKKNIHFAPMCIHEGGGSETLKLTAGLNVDYPNSNNKAEYYNRFYVFGSTRNIPQDYSGAQANKVVNKRLTLDPLVHPEGYIDLPQFDDNGNIITTTDTSHPFYDNAGNLSYYVADDNVTTRTFIKTITLDDVYPRSDLQVQAVQRVQRYVRDDNDKIVKTASGEYSEFYIYILRLVDGANKPFTIDNSTYSESNPTGNLIQGLELSLHFSSGALTGREFKATYHSKETTLKNESDGTTVHIDSGSFEVVHTEDNTIILPNTGIAPVVGDEVVVFNIRMPDEYVKASYKELEKKAIEKIYELTQDGNEYTVKTNQVWFAENAPTLRLGWHTKLYIVDRTIDTRLLKITESLDRTYDAELSFSKNISKGTINSLFTQINATKQTIVTVSAEDNQAIKQTKKQLYDAQRELLSGKFDTDGYLTAPISPVTIETAMVSVGARSTNFVLSNVTFYPNENGGAKDPNHITVVSNYGKLTHYGIGDDIREWNIAATEVNLEDNAMHYIYAQCNATTGNDGGSIIFSKSQFKYNEAVETQGVYYFLVGSLSSVDTTTNSRVLSLSYGTTAIDGQYVKTGVISSLDGQTYFDLNNGEIGGNIKFSATNIAEVQNTIDEALGISSSVSNAVTTATTADKNSQIARLKADAVPNLFPDPFFLNTNLISPVGRENNTGIVNIPYGGNARLITGRDNVSEYAIPLIEGHVYEYDYWAACIAGSKTLNQSFWWANFDTGNGWLNYNRYPSEVVETRLVSNDIITDKAWGSAWKNGNGDNYKTITGEHNDYNYKIILLIGYDDEEDNDYNNGMYERVECSANLVKGVNYTIKFYACMDSKGDSSEYVTFMVGNIQMDVDITPYWAEYTLNYTPTQNTDFIGFSASDYTDVYLCGVRIYPTVAGITTEWNHYKALVTPEASMHARVGKPFFQIEQDSASTKCQWLLTNLVITDAIESQKLRELDYLRESLTEATSDTTDITGGLVLSKFIGVKGSDNNVVAGMNGTSITEDGELPMIFAGRSTNNPLGTFRVSKAGQVESSNSDYTQRLIFDSSQLRFFNGIDELNVITSAKATSIANMLTGANLSTGSTGSISIGTLTTTESSALQGFLREDCHFPNVGVLTTEGQAQDAANEAYIYASSYYQTIKGRKYTKKVLILTPEADGVMRLTASPNVQLSASAKATKSTYKVYDGSSISTSLMYPDYPLTDHTDDLSWSYSIKIGGKSFTLDELNNNYASISIPIIKGVAVYLEASLTFESWTFGFETTDDRKGQYEYDSNIDVYELYLEPMYRYYGQVSVTATIGTLSYTLSQTAYRNATYANGLMMAESTDKYFGIMPSDTNDLWKSVAPKAGIGLRQNYGAWIASKTANNTLAYFGIPFVIMRVRLSYSAMKTTWASDGISFLYNPLVFVAGSSVYVKKRSTGRYDFRFQEGAVGSPLSYSDQSYSVIANSGIADSDTSGAMTIKAECTRVKGYSSGWMWVQVCMSDDSSENDMDVILTIIHHRMDVM